MDAGSGTWKRSQDGTPHVDTAGAQVTLEVVGTAPAGSAPGVEVGPGEAVRIMTGAILPAGAECIPTNTDQAEARITRVVDGDTIDVDIGGQTFRVRYIGMDTPETVDPRRPVGLLRPGGDGKEPGAR